MTTEHELKTWPEPYQALVSGRKRFEIRKNDRGFARGDVLWLREWMPAPETLTVDTEETLSVRGPGGYTGRESHWLVTYLVPGGCWGLPADLCVMSVEPAPAPAAPPTNTEE